MLHSAQFSQLKPPNSLHRDAFSRNYLRKYSDVIKRARLDFLHPTPKVLPSRQPTQGGTQ